MSRNRVWTDFESGIGTVNDIIKTVVAPVLGLIGVLVGVVFGYRQWKKQHALARYGAILTERQQAYKDTWSRLEEIHLFIRTEQFEESRFFELVRSVNSHLMKVGLVLDRGDKGLVNAYMQALEALGRSLLDAKASSERDKAVKTLHDTSPIPPEMLERVQGLRVAYENVESARENLISHFRAVIGVDQLS